MEWIFLQGPETYPSINDEGFSDVVLGYHNGQVTPVYYACDISTIEDESYSGFYDLEYGEPVEFITHYCVVSSPGGDKVEFTNW